jgi:hypothetical protein
MQRRDFFKVLGSFMAVAAAGPMPAFAAVEAAAVPASDPRLQSQLDLVAALRADGMVPFAVEGRTVFYRRRTPGYQPERLTLLEALEVMERRLPVAAEIFGPMKGVAYGCRIDWE